MSARDAILARVRRSLGVDGTEPDRRATAEARMHDAPIGLIPARGQLDPAGQRALFRAMAEKVSSSVVAVASGADVPAAIADYLRSKNLPPSFRRGDDPRLAAMPWDSQPNLEISTGISDGHDLVSVSHAVGAIAETGTLALQSGGDNPTTLNFLPDHHIVVVDAGAIVGDYETFWAGMRQRFGKGVMPRTVNFVTGPSRSGDIEQTILLGAHGPRALHIIMVG
ncbi:MAG: lactate utilization protein [Hyphomicrobiaceae bacterium]|nr:lactate utilization protein [Hyphomicrobiaceae bacterium]